MRIDVTRTEARLRLRVSAAAEAQIRKGHPWVFDESITEQNRAGVLGELAVIYDKQNRFLAIGLFDPESPLRVRILHRGSPVQIDESFWQRRLREAVEKRRALASIANGYRLINGESDAWPGLVLDKYDSTVVLKLYSAAWLDRLGDIATLINSELRPLRIALRLSRNIQALAQERFQRADGTVIRGAALSGPVIFEESGLRFEADVLRGQKTGFFLDQRENRRQVRKLVAERRLRTVLNAFSFSGGFSLYAAAAGAKSVVDLDISAHALESARRNFELNCGDEPAKGSPSPLNGQRLARTGDSRIEPMNRLPILPLPEGEGRGEGEGAVRVPKRPVRNGRLIGRGRTTQPHSALAVCTHQTIQADAFEWLAQSKERFDLVILDPPSMARRAVDRDQALVAYARLVTRAIPRLSKGGILLACSCSAHVKETEFFDLVRRTARKSHRSFRELLTMIQPEDHPATFPEGRYLKSIYLELDR